MTKKHEHDEEKRRGDEEEIHLKVTDKRFWAKETGDEKKEEKEGEPDLDRIPYHVKELQREKEESEKKLKEYIAAYKQKMAEQDEFRQRLQNDVQRRVDDGIAGFLRSVLPVIDNLDFAINHANETHDVEKLLEGIRMTRKGLMQMLEGYGMKSVGCAGEKFNPATAEALQAVEVFEEEKDGTVIDVLQAGFMMNERLLRPAKVTVGKYKGTQ